MAASDGQNSTAVIMEPVLMSLLVRVLCRFQRLFIFKMECGVAASKVCAQFTLVIYSNLVLRNFYVLLYSNIPNKDK